MLRDNPFNGRPEAQQLAKDISAGKADLGSLDLEALGQQVLSNVAPGDVSSFASNLDQILPALSRLQRP